jgi:alpha-ketoglutarate-dependent taurine dioxygenase
MRLEKLNPFGVLVLAEQEATVRDVKPQTMNALIQEHKLVVLRGFKNFERDDFLSFCESVPGFKTLNWNFGPVMEMKESQDPQNYLFSREQVPFHWDGAFHQVPDFLVFSCVQAPLPNAGGETLFANTEKIYNDASEDVQGIWAQAKLKYETEKVAHYGGSIMGPLVQEHPESRKKILRFAEPVSTKLNPVTLEISNVPLNSGEMIIQDLTKKIYDSRYCYRHQWQEGDLLIADNHSLIHGRTAFEQNCPRHLRRIQLVKESK